MPKACLKNSNTEEKHQTRSRQSKMRCRQWLRLDWNLGYFLMWWNCTEVMNLLVPRIHPEHLLIRKEAKKKPAEWRAFRS